MGLADAERAEADDFRSTANCISYLYDGGSYNIIPQLTTVNELCVSFQLKEDFRSALFNLALMMVNDQKRPLDAVPVLQQLLKVSWNFSADALSSTVLILTQSGLI